MPSLTATSLDRLLESSSRNPNLPVKMETIRANSRPVFASPALYATPAVTPLPFSENPCCTPPSPYIVNHKIRGPRLKNPARQLEVEKEVNSKEEVEEIGVDESLGIVLPVVSVEESDSGNGIVLDEEAEDFLDFVDSMSSVSNMEVEDGFAVEGLRKVGAEMGEFYDAYDEISSDGGSRSSSRMIEDEIREMRLNLLTEIEKRKQAEDAFENLQLKWRNLREHLLAQGLVLPNPNKANREEEAIVDPAEDLSQQIIVSRVVAASIERGCAAAAVEMEMKPLMDAKNFEISRLLDRLRYYEATNREMSQRNQEAVEKARQLRHRRRSRRRKWLWGSIGLAMTIGSAAIAWSYLPASTPPVSNDD